MVDGFRSAMVVLFYRCSVCRRLLTARSEQHVKCMPSR